MQTMIEEQESNLSRLRSETASEERALNTAREEMEVEKAQLLKAQSDFKQR